jgi:hypothetical protein
VLDVHTAPDDVNFFEVGGDSPLLLVLLERLNIYARLRHGHPQDEVVSRPSTA